MRKLVVTEFLSLDGVFEAPGPDGSGFTYEGWTFPYVDDDFMKFKSEELWSADVQLLGRVTYEGFAAAWPDRTGDAFSDKFNSMPKYVVSNTLKDVSWRNSHILKDNIVEEVNKLKAEPGQGTILVAGSGQLVRFLLDHDLVDQLNLLIYPVILGEGKKLFEGMQKKELKPIESQVFSKGVLKVIYEAK